MRYHLEEILDSVCIHFDLTPVDVFQMTRKKNIITARHIFLYLSCKHTPYPFHVIGYFSTYYKRTVALDHATVIHAKNKIKGFVSIGDRETIKNLDIIEESLKENAVKQFTKLLPSRVNLLEITVRNEKYLNNHV